MLEIYCRDSQVKCQWEMKVNFILLMQNYLYSERRRNAGEKYY